MNPREEVATEEAAEVASTQRTISSSDDPVRVFVYDLAKLKFASSVCVSSVGENFFDSESRRDVDGTELTAIGSESIADLCICLFTNFVSLCCSASRVEEIRSRLFGVAVRV